VVARVIPNVGTHLVDHITGEEVFSCRAGSQRDKEITAENLRKYFGGDVASPAIRPERGGGSQRMSEFPNAEFSMSTDDRLTGLQNGVNVNFSRAQILGPLIEAIGSLIDERVAEALRERDKGK
jgi:hypothetical protein